MIQLSCISEHYSKELKSDFEMVHNYIPALTDD